MRSQPDLNNYLRDDLEPEDIFIDDEILDNEFNGILHQNILNIDGRNVEYKIIDKEEKMNTNNGIQITS